jgi:hypothetical protein
MEIDFPKVVLFVLAVLPGYFALWARRSIAPLSLHKKGATEELAEFLVYSALVHFVLITIVLCTAALLGMLYHRAALFFLKDSLSLPVSTIAENVVHLPASLLLIYVPLSFFCGWGIGLTRGLLTMWRPFTRLAAWVGINETTPAGKLWLRLVGRFLLTGRPIIYDALFPEEDETGKSKLVFVELVLKDDGGKYIGQVEAFTITRDEEEHKLLYMIDVYKENSEDGSFEEMPTDGMLVDLADVVTMSVRQTSD